MTQERLIEIENSAPQTTEFLKKLSLILAIIVILYTLIYKNYSTIKLKDQC